MLNIHLPITTWSGELGNQFLVHFASLVYMFVLKRNSEFERKKAWTKMGTWTSLTSTLHASTSYGESAKRTRAFSTRSLTFLKQPGCGTGALDESIFSLWPFCWFIVEHADWDALWWATPRQSIQLNWNCLEDFTKDSPEIGKDFSVNKQICFEVEQKLQIGGNVVKKTNPQHTTRQVVHPFHRPRYACQQSHGHVTWALAKAKAKNIGKISKFYSFWNRPTLGCLKQWDLNNTLLISLFSLNLNLFF